MESAVLFEFHLSEKRWIKEKETKINQCLICWIPFFGEKFLRTDTRTCSFLNIQMNTHAHAFYGRGVGCLRQSPCPLVWGSVHCSRVPRQCLEGILATVLIPAWFLIPRTLHLKSPKDWASTSNTVFYYAKINWKLPKCEKIHSSLWCHNFCFIEMLHGAGAAEYKHASLISYS